MYRYERYHIPSEPAPNRAPHPSRFRVHVDRVKLAGLLVKEFIHYRADMDLVLSRPCVYGVFAGPVGGFAPRQEKCVGCLRCTVQYPDIVQIEPNPERLHLGDSYFTPDKVDTILYEASTGRVPVRGAGYRGSFGGQGWDGMWTDMSEIVRPTRDGIHGREFISTAVDLGGRPRVLDFERDGSLRGELPDMISLQLPILLDRPPRAAQNSTILSAYARSAASADTLAIVPIERLTDAGPDNVHVVPVVRSGSTQVPNGSHRMVSLEGWDPETFERLAQSFRPDRIVLRLPFGEDLMPAYERGVRVFHLTADYHGRTGQGEFILDAIRRVHQDLVQRGLRQRLTLIGSGGIISAEHVPKAIICGLDAVAIDTAPLIALQARLDGEARSEDQAELALPVLEPGWAQQRVQNLLASWRDQLLEIMGAMGLREVRRLRGETGRAMFQADLEREAFSEIEGYSNG